MNLANSQKKAERNLKLLNVLAFMFGFDAVAGVMAVYFATVAGSVSLGMTALAVMNLSASLFEVPTGVFSDQVGRRKTLVIYYVVIATAFLLFYLADSAAWLMAGTVLMGIAMALKSGTMSAFVYENLEVLGRENEFSKQEGYRQALGRYALMSAALVGSVAIAFYDIRAAVLISLVVYCVGVLVSLGLLDVREDPKLTTNVYARLGLAWKQFRADTTLRDISVATIISRGGGNIEYRFRSLFFALIMPEWLVNLLGMVNNLTSALGMTYAHRLVQRWGFVKTLVQADVLDKIITSICILTRTIPTSFVMNIVSGLMFGMRSVAGEDLLQERYSKDQRATMGSMVGLASSLLYGVLGIGFGLVADKIGIVNTLLILQGILLVATWFYRKGIIGILGARKV